jgi:poly-gamma-glutamate synthesis protein (capsule biosynthesis protein)
VDAQLYRPVRTQSKAALACALSLLVLLPVHAPTADRAPALILVLAGDVMLGRGVARALDGEWEAAFAQVRPWLAGDGPLVQRVLSVVNLESPLTVAPQVRRGHDLRAPPAAVAALREAGIDAVSLANNHALDAGPKGLRETKEALRAAGIAAWTEQATRVPCAGIGSWVGFGSVVPGPICAGLAFDDSVRPLDLETAVGAVSAAARQAEIVIVSIHWGGEYQAAPSARQQAIAQALAEAGADVIAGHGPHVPQRIEWVGETLVAYSLGNFLFDQLWPEDCTWGAILRVTLCDGRAVAVEVVPTVADRGRVRPAEEETRAEILERLGQREHQ